MRKCYYLYKYIIGMGEELQDALKDIEEMKVAISEKIEKMRSKVTDLITEIDGLSNKFKDRTEKFIEDKRKQLTEKLNSWKKIIEDKIAEFAKKIDEFLNKVKKRIQERLEKMLASIVKMFLSVFPN